MSPFNLPIHSRASSTTNQHTNSVTTTSARYEQTIATKDETIRRLYQQLLSQSKEIFELTQENEVMRGKLLDEIRSHDDKTKEIIELRKSNNALRYELDTILSEEEKDVIEERVRPRRGLRLSGRERAIRAYRIVKQRTLNAHREAERAEAMGDDGEADTEERSEDVGYWMPGLDLAKVDGKEMEVAGNDERSLSLE